MSLKPTSLLRTTIDQAFQKMLVTIGGLIPSVVPGDFSVWELDYTMAPVNLFVDPTGNDENPGTQNLPFRQVKAALERLPKRIRHLVTVNVAPGSYDGFAVQGFCLDAINDSGAGIFLKGGLSVTTDLTQSTPTGTITSSTTGNATTAVWTRVFDTTKNWVVDQLKGKMVRWTVAGTTTILMIMENDATSFKVGSSGAAAADGTAYEICDGACLVNGTPVLIPGNLPTLTAVGAASPPCQIAVVGNTFSLFSTSIRIEGFRTSIASPTSTSRGIFIDTSNGIVALGRCQINSMSQGIPLQMLGSGTVGLTTVAALSASSSAVFAGGSTGSSAPNVSMSGVILGSSSITVNLGAGHSQGVTLFNTQIDGPIGINVIGFCNIQTSGIARFVNGSSQGIRSRVASSSVGGTYILVFTGSSLEMVGRSVGIELNGAHQAVIDGNLILSSCTRGIVCERGAKCGISAGSTMTTTTTELTVDSSTTTLALMRATSPKLFSNAYGSAIYE